MSLRPFAPHEFDALWAAVAGADPTVAVGGKDPERLLFDEGDRGKGHGTAAVKALAVRLFDEAGARRLEAGTTDDNVAMRAVLERVGFREEGVRRRFYPSNDAAGADCVMCGMTRDDYEDVKTRWT